MTVVTLDSNDTAGILADAGITLDQPTAAQPNADSEKPPVEGAKPATVAAPEHADDEEDENGLTAEQRRILTKNMQHAIGKKTAKLRNAEEFAAAQFNEKQMAIRRAEDLERENAELKAKLTPKASEVEATVPEQPKRENFANENAYVDAMIQYGIDKRMAEIAKEDAENKSKREYQQRIDAAADRIRGAIKAVPDFEEVVGGSDLQLTPAIGTYLEESEMVAELSYYLAKNPDVLVSLAKLSPHAQLVKIGKIESTLTPFETSKTPPNGDKPSEVTSNGKTPKVAPSADTGIDLSKPRSKPAPVFSPLDASGSAGNPKDPKDMDIRESIEDYAQRNQLNLNRRKRH